MWTDLRTEVETIRKHFAFTAKQFQPVGLNDWLTIEEAIYQAFCKLSHSKLRPVWLWEYFKLDTFGVTIEQKAYLYLDKLIDNNETVWFFVNETVNETQKFWFYEGRVKPIQTIIGECCYIDEIYLVSKKYNWLICINHHDVLFATGQIMPTKLRELKISINH